MGNSEEILKKLSLFLGEGEAKDCLSKAVDSCGVVMKKSYSQEEMTKILYALIKLGGFAEFVATNMKAELLLK